MTSNVKPCKRGSSSDHINSKKRTKVNEDAKLPNEVIEKLAAFLDFDTLLQFRAANRFFRKAAEQTMSDSVLSQLPLEFSPKPGYDGYGEFTLKAVWPEEFKSKESVVTKAMKYADPGGQVSRDMTVSRNEARKFLENRGSVSVSDFVDEFDEDYDGETGWKVNCRYVPFFASKKDARRLCDRAISHMYEFGNDEGDEFDDTKLKKAILGLLVKAERLSFGSYDYNYGHPDYSSCGKHQAIMFIIQGSQKKVSITYDLDSALDY